MKYLRRFIFALVYALPAVLYCSYHPIIKLGESTSMNFELSLPLIWLVIFDLTTFITLIVFRKKLPKSTSLSHKRLSKSKKTPSTRTALSGSPASKGFKPGWLKNLLVRHDHFPGISDRKFFLFSLFPLFATLSILWSPNPTRAILTAGIIWLLFFAIFALLYVLPLLKLPGTFKRNCLRSFFIASIVVCFICWLQCFLDLAGIARESTLLCRGCTYLSFGFPHPSGLAIEPQFMGNLLLAPTLLSLWMLMEQSRLEKKHIIPMLLLTLLFSSTLFLTFSRGAIYAYAVALFVLLIFAYRRHLLRASLIIVPCASFIFILAVQGLFTVIGPTHGIFIDGVSRSIHQLSLGIIDLRPASSDSSVSNNISNNDSDNASSNTSSDSTSDASTSDDTPEQPFFEGYVPESTNVRLDLNQAAIDTWLSAPGYPESRIEVGLSCLKFGCCPCTGSGPLTPTTVFFGVGLGGAGVAMYRNSFITHITSPKEIVQNQPLSLLLELGLVGIALALFGLYLALFSRDARRDLWLSPALPLLTSLIIAYLITLNFFSGLPNALHIYLLPPLFYLLFHKNSCISPK